jgi:hypothetical protein
MRNRQDNSRSWFALARVAATNVDSRVKFVERLRALSRVPDLVRRLVPRLNTSLLCRQWRKPQGAIGAELDLCIDRVRGVCRDDLDRSFKMRSQSTGGHPVYGVTAGKGRPMSEGLRKVLMRGDGLVLHVRTAQLKTGWTFVAGCVTLCRTVSITYHLRSSCLAPSYAQSKHQPQPSTTQH